METKVNYVVVGVFALLLSAAFIAGILWLSASKGYDKSSDIYYADMYESVSGLNLSAPVKYRGVEVGQVRKISLDKTNPEKVRLELAIEHGVPIKQDTIATLKSQGLTGIAFVELSGGTAASPLLLVQANENYPVIRAGTSLMGRLDASMSGLLGSLSKTADSANDILDDDNRKTMKRILADLATITSTLAAHRGEMDKIIINSANMSEQMPPLLERINKATANIEKMTQEASRASSSVRKTLDGVANEGLPEAERMMVDMRELIGALQRVTTQIEQNPSVLLRGSDSKRRGPGE
jgi:phospholipid/cholesterol/gamma-HCH transport system substrate-binding protein